jgi:PAS domain S-box-containing protein
MTGPLRVLMVEDSATDAHLVIRELRRTGRSIEFQRVEDAGAMRAALESKSWDVVISDWSMPKFTAAAALGILKEKGLDLPFIIVSGTIGEEAAVEAMRAGAHDYVLKDRLARLTPAVERELRESEARRGSRRTKAALRASEARFAKLAESGIISIVVGDLTGNAIEANDAFLRMVGYSREDLRAGKVRWRDLAPVDWQTESDDAFEQLKAHGATIPYEKEYIRKDGSRVSVLVGVAQVDESHWIAFMADLSGQKQTERALRQTEEQLRQAQKMEAVGRLAGGVAHDFNNVLSVILSYSEMMLGDLEPGDAMREDIEEIRNAGRRAADLTRQLLMFSRQQVLETKVVDLNDVLSGMDKMLQRILGEDVEMVSLAAPSLGRVRVDPSSLEHVIMNLVVNARDAMPTGGKLTMETANVVLDWVYAQQHVGVKAGPHVMLAVSDTGIGMDKATMARIFEPFFTTKAKDKGTGLGLSTVFGIVQQSAGSVWVYSEPGKGTTFKVYLPSVDAAVEVAHPQPPTSTLCGSETILLVEDEAQVRVVARGILQRNGYDVLEARNASEAILLCETHPAVIHLLLSDVVMPQMSGPELAKRLAQARPEMRVLCMSGYTDDSIVRHGVLGTEMAYLQKPITPQTLTKKVREVLDAPNGNGHIA